jgi:hypothetical protein
VDEHAILEMPPHRPRKHGALDVAADPRERLGRVVMGDAGDVLVDDRAGVELGVT